MPKRDDSRGLKKRTMPKEGIFNGQTAPLWDNPKPGFFLGLFYQAFTQLFLFQIANAVYISTLDDCQVSVKNLPLICLTCLLIYGLAALRMFHIKYATDTEWSLYIVRFIVSLIFGMTLCVGAFGILFLNYIYTGDNSNDASIPSCTGASVFTSPQTLFVVVNIAGVVVIQVQIIFFLLFVYVQFYIMNSESKFSYKSTRQVMLLD